MGLFSKSNKIKSKILSITDFQYSGAAKIDDKIDKIEATTISASTNRFNVDALKDKVAKFPIVCVGGAACRIGERIEELNNNEKLLSLFLIDSDEKVNRIRTDKKLVINSGKPLNHHFTRGQRVIAAELPAVQSFLENGGITKSDSSKIVFVIVSAGGTGSGVGLGVIDHLISIGKRPVPIMLLPFKEESSRLLFNSATLLYHCTYGPKSVNRDLLSILVDLEHFATLNAKVPYSELLGLINDRIASVLIDILLLPHLEGTIFPIDYSEFESTFTKLKGASSLIMLDVPSDFDFLSDYKLALPLGNSIQDKPSKAIRGLLGLQSGKNNITIENYRNMLSYFKNNDILAVLNEDSPETETKIRGLMLGYEMPDRVVEIFDNAKNVRLKVLNTEEKLRNETAYVPNIEGIDEKNDYEPVSLDK